MKKILVLFLIFCSYLVSLHNTNKLFADEQKTKIISKKYSNYWLKTSFGSNFNMHNAKFSQLPGTDTLASEMTEALTSSYFINFGLEYLLKNKLFGMKSKYSLALGLNKLNADFSKSRFIGNDIDPLEFSPASSTQELLTDLSYISINQKLYFEAFENLPLSFGLGFAVMFPVSTIYEQAEKLTNALPGTTFENGSLSRGESSGEIKKMNSYNIGLDFSLRYKVYSFSNIDFYTDLAYSYGLINLNENVDWKVNTFSAGITIAYRTEKKKMIIPKNPITPKLPNPPKPPKLIPLIMEQIVSNNDKNLHNNQSININISVKEYFEEYKLQPYIFYENSNIEYLSASNRNLTTIEKSAKMEMLLSIIKYLKNNSELTVTINTYEQDKKGVAQKRIDKLETDLINAGINKNRIYKKVNILDLSSLKYDELKEEYNRVEFQFSNNIKLVPYSFTKKSIFNINEDEYLVELRSNRSNTKFTNKVRLNGEKIIENKREKFKVKLNNSLGKYFNFTELNQLEIESTAESGNQKQQSVFQLGISSNIVSRDTIQNIITLNDGNQVEQYVAAYFEFDSAELNVYNKDLIDKIREAVSHNKRVVILPLTDNLGDMEHNKALAKRRAENYLRLLKLEKNSIEIEYPKKFVFSNNHPYGRMLNRSIIVRIFSK